MRKEVDLNCVRLLTGYICEILLNLTVEINNLTEYVHRQNSGHASEMITIFNQLNTLTRINNNEMMSDSDDVRRINMTVVDLLNFRRSNAFQALLSR